MRLMLNKNWRDLGHLVGRNLHFWNWHAWLPDEHQENVWHVMFLCRIGVSMRDKDCIELSVSASWCFRGGHDTCFACKGNLPAWVRHPLSTACSLKCKRKISLQFLWVVSLQNLRSQELLVTVHGGLIWPETVEVFDSFVLSDVFSTCVFQSFDQIRPPSTSETSIRDPLISPYAGHYEQWKGHTWHITRL